MTAPMFTFATITCCQVQPPPPPDDLLHAVLVSSRDAVPEDEDEDELEVVAEIHHQTEPAVSTVQYSTVHSTVQYITRLNLPSGNHHRSDASTNPIHRLGTIGIEF